MLRRQKWSSGLRKLKRLGQRLNVLMYFREKMWMVILSSARVARVGYIWNVVALEVDSSTMTDKLKCQVCKYQETEKADLSLGIELKGLSMEM